MPGVITTGSLPKLNWPGLRTISGATYRQHPKVFPHWTKQVDSNKGWEEYQGITGFSFGKLPVVIAPGIASSF